MLKTISSDVPIIQLIYPLEHWMSVSLSLCVRVCLLSPPKPRILMSCYFEETRQ